MKNLLFAALAAASISTSSLVCKANWVDDDFLCEDCVIQLPTNDDDPFDVLSDMMIGLKKIRTLNGLVYDKTFSADHPVGTAKIRIGKFNKRKQTTKLTVKISLFSGKSFSSSKEIQFDEDDSSIGVMTFKNPVGSLKYALYYNRDYDTFLFIAANSFEYEEADFWIYTGYVVNKNGLDFGGFDIITDLLFWMDAETEPDWGNGWKQVGSFPVEEPIYVKNNKKFTFNSVPVIKYAKIGGKESTAYELIGFNDATKTNYSALKLNYSANSGAFKGTFKVYASNEDASNGKKPKLKKYTAKVNGYIVSDGFGYSGYGAATLKIGKKQYVYPVRLIPIITGPNRFQ